MKKGACIHHWMISDHNFGRCKKCGATKDFAKLQEKRRNRQISLVRGAK